MLRDQVVVKLSDDAALVLFDLLATINERGSWPSFIAEADQRVLWDLEASLEPQLTALFDDDYGTRLAEAKEALRTKPE